MKGKKAWWCQECREVMSWHEDYECWKCDLCQTEVYERFSREREPSEAEQIAEAFENDGGYVSRSCPERFVPPPGGSKTARKKKPAKRLSEFERKYFQT